MSGYELVSAFWSAMQDNDWERATDYLRPDCAIDWPCSGEQIVGRTDFAAVQATYPSSTGSWRFQIHRIVDGADTVVSEVTVTDGQQSARVVTFSEIAGDQIVHQVEYWPAFYEPPAGREQYTRPGERIP